MPDILQKQIENHLAIYPDHYQDVLEMKKEWADYKAKTFWVLVGFVGSILSIGVWVGTMQTNIDNITQDHVAYEEHVEQMDRRLGLLEVTNGEIKARLTSIDLILQEIKLSINQLK